jgi:uncharacterized protein (TIGR03435 family)
VRVSRRILFCLALPTQIAFVTRTEMSLSSVQASLARPTFEVASVKRGEGLGGSSFYGCYITGAVMAVIPKGRCIFRNATLIGIIAEAYDIPPRRIDELISGGPGWIRTERYNIEAKAEHDFASTGELKLMTQSLLSERFKLTLHEITLESAGYALVVGKNGPKLRASDDGLGVPGTGGGPGVITGHAVSMARLANTLANRLRQPVVDNTGINGSYDFKLTFGANDQSGPSIFTALQEEMGLKLESQKVPQRGLVIDHVEKPVED